MDYMERTNDQYRDRISQMFWFLSLNEFLIEIYRLTFAQLAVPSHFVFLAPISSVAAQREPSDYPMRQSGWQRPIREICNFKKSAVQVHFWRPSEVVSKIWKKKKSSKHKCSVL